KHVRPLLIRDDDVREAVAVDVADPELCADAGIRVDYVWPEADAAVFLLLGLEPIEHRRPVGTRLAAAVRPPALAGHQVFEAVATDVHAVHRVRFREKFPEEILLEKLVRAALLVNPDAEFVG